MHKTVMIFGTFDGIHAGHISLIEQASLLAEKVVAVIAKDDTVKTIKGKYPLHTEEERAHVLSHIREIDKVLIGNNDDKFSVVKEIHPDVIVLGYDQEAFIDQLYEGMRKHHMNIEIVRANSYNETKLKSGKLRSYYEGTSPV